MSWFKASLRLISALVLSFALSASLLPLQLAGAQQGQQAQATSTAKDYTAALAEIEKALDARRKELGIPGLSLVIVKDDKIIYMKGLGEKDIEKKLPVTPDTRFAIGSASKAWRKSSSIAERMMQPPRQILVISTRSSS